MKKSYEAHNLKTFDKASYKDFIKKSINDSTWIPIFEKNVDFCADFVPKYSDAFIKNINMTKDECDMKPILVFHCLTVTGFMVL